MMMMQDYNEAHTLYDHRVSLSLHLSLVNLGIRCLYSTSFGNNANDSYDKKIRFSISDQLLETKSRSEMQNWKSH